MFDKMEAQFRIERDSMGEIKVPAHSLWGAQTQRSLENFKIGSEKMPFEIIKAMATLKKAAAQSNFELELMHSSVMGAITFACDEIMAGKYNDQFPLSIWQTGSGTQTNMNVNEVIAHLANDYLGENGKIHPNDDVNKGQSSNDTFPTAMHMVAVTEIEDRLLPAIGVLEKTFGSLSEEYATIRKIGRTHLQDATPLTLGQEISGWQYSLTKTSKMIENSLEHLRELAIGGTAVGTGINAHPDFGKMTAERISLFTGTKFVSSDNKFHALTSKDALVNTHGAMKALAADLMKIANDVRWLSSGPRCGIGELIIPENEPGSSIMPGKVNPTQCEALTMVCCQVMANDTAVGIAASQGNFELNVYMPVMIYNVLQSIHLLADAILSFHDHCAVGIKPNERNIRKNLEASLMLVTSLAPHIGYDNAAKIAKNAHEKDLTLKESALELKLLTEEEFDSMMKYE